MKFAFNYIRWGHSARNLKLFVQSARSNARFTTLPSGMRDYRVGAHHHVRFVACEDGMMFYGGGGCMHGHLIACAETHFGRRLHLIHGEADIDPNTGRLVFWLTLGERLAHARPFKDKLKKIGFDPCINPRSYVRGGVVPTHFGLYGTLGVSDVDDAKAFRMT